MSDLGLFTHLKYVQEGRPGPCVLNVLTQTTFKSAFWTSTNAKRKVVSLGGECYDTTISQVSFLDINISFVVQRVSHFAKQKQDLCF